MKHLPLVTKSRAATSPRLAAPLCPLCGRLDKLEINRPVFEPRSTKKNFYRGLNRNFPLPLSSREGKSGSSGGTRPPDRTAWWMTISATCSSPLGSLLERYSRFLDRERSELSIFISRTYTSRSSEEEEEEDFSWLVERKDRSLFTGEKVADASIGR